MKTKDRFLKDVLAFLEECKWNETVRYTEYIIHKHAMSNFTIVFGTGEFVEYWDEEYPTIQWTYKHMEVEDLRKLRDDDELFDYMAEFPQYYEDFAHGKIYEKGHHPTPLNREILESMLSLGGY